MKKKLFLDLGKEISTTVAETLKGSDIKEMIFKRIEKEKNILDIEKEISTTVAETLEGSDIKK